MNKNYTQSILNIFVFIAIALSSGCGQSSITNPSKPFDPKGSLIYADYKDIYILDFKTKKTNLLHSGKTSHIEFAIVNNSIYYRGSKFETPDIIDVYRINLDGSGFEQITFNGDINCLSGTPNGKYIAYAEGKTLTLFIYDVKNNTSLRIGNDTSCPLWSPDGRKFVYLEKPYALAFGKLILYSLENNKSIEISPNVAPYNGIAWSPDGDKILLKTGNLQSSSLNILDLKNHKIDQLTDDKDSFYGYDLTWSPSQNMISYFYNSSYHIKPLQNLNDEQTINILQSNIPTWIYQNVWSPNGRYFAYFTAYDEVQIDLVVQNIETQENAEIQIPGTWVTSTYWIYP